jgi:hypothetical protein
MKRTLLLGSAWTAAAAAAVGLGFLAVSLVDASASPGSQPASATATATPSGTAGETPATSSSSPTAAPTPTDLPPVVTDGQHVSDGGSVYASCADGVPVLASAPSPGWWLDDSNDLGKVEFENGTLEIEVRVACVAGTPQFSVEGPQADDSSGRGSSTPAPSSAAVPVDDSAGRSGGGHGSDDPPGDDHGGDRGGRGSDDPPGDDHGGDRGGHGSDD